MASTSVSRALKRSAQLAAKRVPRRASAEAPVNDHVARARADFTYFCAAMGKPPAPHMLEWHRELVTGQGNEHLMDVAGPDTCLLSPRGPLDLDTPVLTPHGWRPLRTISRGDIVYDSAGRPTEVLETTHYGKAPCWDVHLGDGTVVRCDDSHKWRVRTGPPARNRWMTVTLQQLRMFVPTSATGGLGDRDHHLRPVEPGETPWICASGRSRWRVPLCEPPQREEVPLLIEPYVLGVLVARGAMGGSGVRFTSSDPDLLARVRDEVPDGCEVRRVSAGTVVWSIVGEDRKRDRGARRLSSNPLLPPLDLFGLLGVTGDERKLPQVYLEGSISQRLALLQGLLDAAGRSISGGTIMFTTRSIEVARAVLELARSLGALAWQPLPRGPNGKGSRRPSHVVNMVFDQAFEPFHCSAKAQAYVRRRSARIQTDLTRAIVDICPAGEREIGCLSVASGLRNFLIKDYVISCNSAKSTEIGLLCAWLIGRHVLAHRLLRILYVSFNIDVARGKSLAIKNTIQAPEYREIFPMVRLSKDRTSDELWSIDFAFAEIDVRGEDAFTLACAGLHGTITSKRSSLVILDDLIKSEKSIRNPDTRREMEANWNSVIVPTMFQGARAIALGTRFHFDDIFATTFTEQNGWRVMIQAALLFDDEGEPRSYWPEMWSLSTLLEKQRKDRISFAYQYMNQAVRSKELGISPELFVKGQIPDSFDEIGVGIDLSSGLSERNDYTVFILGGRDGDKAYIIDKRRIRSMGNIEKVEALCELLHEWNLLGRGDDGRFQPTFSQVMIWPEEVSYQKSFQGDFRRIAEQEWQLTNLVVSPVKGIRGDKLARFRGVIGLFETQKVVFNKYRDFQVVFEEVMNLGNAPHDDCVDALQVLLSRLFRRGNAEVEWA